MATPVTRITPVDASLGTNPDYAYFTEYRIESNGGSTYIVDSRNRIVYDFTPLGGTAGLQPTNGSYDVFLAFLAANPVTATESPPTYNGPTATAAITTAQTFIRASGATVPSSLTSYEAAMLQRMDTLIVFARAAWLAIMALPDAIQANPNQVAVDSDDFVPSAASAVPDGEQVWS